MGWLFRLQLIRTGRLPLTFARVHDMRVSSDFDVVAKQLRKRVSSNYLAVKLNYNTLHLQVM
jgi:hypothetical protein